jgi:hypothetical protein
MKIFYVCLEVLGQKYELQGNWLINLIYIFLFRNKNISKKLKFPLKNTIIDKMLTYASETLKLTEIESNWTFLKGKCIEEF